ncbi:unnamed protein product [Closterium sp. Yama58-4]|nr:unnamed protein product [Closterium sp. Yama58-4]
MTSAVPGNPPEVTQAGGFGGQAARAARLELVEVGSPKKAASGEASGNEEEEEVEGRVAEVSGTKGDTKDYPLGLQKGENDSALERHGSDEEGTGVVEAAAVGGGAMSGESRTEMVGVTAANGGGNINSAASYPFMLPYPPYADPRTLPGFLNGGGGNPQGALGNVAAGSAGDDAYAPPFWFGQEPWFGQAPWLDQSPWASQSPWLTAYTDKLPALGYGPGYPRYWLPQFYPAHPEAPGQFFSPRPAAASSDSPSLSWSLGPNLGAYPGAWGAEPGSSAYAALPAPTEVAAELSLLSGSASPSGSVAAEAVSVALEAVSAAPEAVSAAPEAVSAALEAAAVTPEAVSVSSASAAAAAAAPAAAASAAAAEAAVSAAPEAVSVAPEAVSAAPEAVSAAPEAVSAAPEAVSVAPEAVSVAPEAVSVAPEAVSAAPATTPEDTPGAPEAVEVAPEVVTASPETATEMAPAAPEAVSAAPEAVSVAPEAVSAAPEAISVAPEAVSAAPEAIPAVPETAAEVTPVAPEAVSAAPEAVSTAPEAVSVELEAVSVAPEAAPVAPVATPGPETAPEVAPIAPEAAPVAPEAVPTAPETPAPEPPVSEPSAPEAPVTKTPVPEAAATIRTTNTEPPELPRRLDDPTTGTVAATRIQSAWRGHSLRLTKPLEAARTIAEVRRLAREMAERLGEEGYAFKVASDPKEKLRVSETIMSWLLRLDALLSPNQEVRELRRGAVRELTKLQDRVDSLKPTAVAAEPVAVPAEPGAKIAAEPTQSASVSCQSSTKVDVQLCGRGSEGPEEVRVVFCNNEEKGRARKEEREEERSELERKEERKERKEERKEKEEERKEEEKKNEERQEEEKGEEEGYKEGRGRRAALEV